MYQLSHKTLLFPAVVSFPEGPQIQIKCCLQLVESLPAEPSIDAADELIAGSLGELVLFVVVLHSRYLTIGCTFELFHMHVGDTDRVEHELDAAAILQEQSNAQKLLVLLNGLSVLTKIVIQHR